MQKEEFVRKIEWMRVLNVKAGKLNEDIESMQKKVDDIDTDIETEMDNLVSLYGTEFYEDIEAVVYRDGSVDDLYDALEKKKLN
jgi:hypothetical protein